MPRHTLHHEGKLAHAIIPSSTSTSVLVQTTLHLDKNLTHARFHSVATTNPLPRNTLHHEQKLAPFRLPYGTSTSALPKATLHHEGNLTHASIPLIVKEISRTCPLLTTTLQCEQKHKHKCIVNNYIASQRKASI